MHLAAASAVGALTSSTSRSVMRTASLTCV
jgi:hypothetical protein